MNHIDFYSGEPSNGSPGFNGYTNMHTQQFSVDPNMRFQQTQYIPQQPQFGYRQPMMQNQYISPGFNGYNSYPQGIQMPNKFSGFRGNPAQEYLETGRLPYYLQQPMFQQQPIFEDKVVHVPGFCPGGSDVLYTEDVDKIVSDLQLEMMVDMEEAIAERNKRFQGYFNNNYGTNYYGAAFYQSQLDMGVVNKYRQKAEAIRQEGYERRLRFNKNLSKLAHGYIGDNMTDEEINQIYEGYSYTIPANVQRVDAIQDELHRMVPVSNQQMYIDHFNQTKQFYQNIVGNSKDMNSFLENQGYLKICEDIEEEMHHRRDGSQYYQADAYKRMLRNNIMEKKGLKENASNPNIPNAAQQIDQFPTLSQCGTLMEDGTMSITAPPWLGNRQMSIDNLNEQHFEENRQRFLQSIYNQGV